MTFGFCGLVLFFLFWLHRTAYRILGPRPGVGLWPSALKAWSLNHWTTYGVRSVVKGHLTRKVPSYDLLGFLGSTTWEVVKNLPVNEGDIRDTGSIPGSGRSPGGGHGSPLQYSCLGNPMDRGAWRATVYGIAKSQTWLKRLSRHTKQFIIFKPFPAPTVSTMQCKILVLFSCACSSKPHPEQVLRGTK